MPSSGARNPGGYSRSPDRITTLTLIGRQIHPRRGSRLCKTSSRGATPTHRAHRRTTKGLDTEHAGRRNTRRCYNVVRNMDYRARSLSLAQIHFHGRRFGCLACLLGLPIPELLLLARLNHVPMSACVRAMSPAESSMPAHLLWPACLRPKRSASPPPTSLRLSGAFRLSYFRFLEGLGSSSIQGSTTQPDARMTFAMLHSLR